MRDTFTYSLTVYQGVGTDSSELNNLTFEEARSKYLDNSERYVVVLRAEKHGFITTVDDAHAFLRIYEYEGDIGDLTPNHDKTSKLITHVSGIISNLNYERTLLKNTEDIQSLTDAITVMEYKLGILRDIRSSIIHGDSTGTRISSF